MRASTPLLLSCSEVDTAYRLRHGTASGDWRAKLLPGKRRGKTIYVSAKRAEKLYGVGE